MPLLEPASIYTLTCLLDVLLGLLALPRLNSKISQYFSLHLEATTLDETPAFQALPYTWGNPMLSDLDDRIKLARGLSVNDTNLFNGKEVETTCNLYNSLNICRGGSLRDCPRIDVICINRTSFGAKRSGIDYGGD